MIINFNDIEEQHIEKFKNGEGIMHSRMMFDGKNRIMLNRLEPQAHSGYHAHQGNCEMIYVLKGTLECKDNDSTETCHAGELHYCENGHSHSFKNIGSDDAEFLAIVPAQP